MCNQSKCKCKAEPGLLEKKSEPHIHAASMKLYAEDAAETDKPWERWEARHTMCAEGVGWATLMGNPEWSRSVQYRRKRKMRVVNGFSVPAPETVSPAHGTKVWVPYTSVACWFYDSKWSNDTHFNTLLSRGLIFLNKDDAIANAKAMCGIDPSS